MAKVTGPDFIALQVRDIQVSRTFYTERLGLVAEQQGPPNAVVFQTQPIAFAIREPSVNLDEVTHLGWGVALWLACDDADALHSSLQSHGTKIVQPPFNGPFGRTFSIADPDGYIVTIHQNK